MKQDNTWYILGMILVVAILLKGGGAPFLQSFVITCTNTELDTLSDIKTQYISDGAITELIQSTPYVIQTENATITRMMQQNYIQANYTSLVLISDSSVTCSNYIGYLKSIDDSELAFYNQKIATNFNGTYYWCNPTSTVTFKGDILDFENYVNKFVSCQEVEIVEEEEVEDNESESTESTESTTSTTSSSGYTEPVEEDYTNNRLLFASVILLIAGLIYYFGYEKGPTRGLIKRRKK